VHVVGVTFIRTGWYLAFGVVFGVLSFMRTNAYKQRTGTSPWHIHPLVWGVASVFVVIFGTLLSIIACSTSTHRGRTAAAGAEYRPARGRSIDPVSGAPRQFGVATPGATALAAWLPDPTGRNELRYFEGSTWTDHVANSGVISVDRGEGPAEAG